MERDDEYKEPREPEEGLGLVKGGAGGWPCLPSDLPWVLPLPSRTLVLGIWQQQEVWGCLCCLSEDVRPCGPRSIGQGRHGAADKDQPDRSSVRPVCSGEVSRRTFPLE